MAIVFFGTFDPFHENHFRLVEHVHKTYQPKKIAIIPNSDTNNNSHSAKGSGFKTEALPLKTRLEILRLRWSNLRPEQQALGRNVEIVDPGPIITNWSGRQKLACQFGRKYHLPVLYVVVGLDSLESTLRRSSQSGKGGYTHNPLDHFILKILAIPRIGYEMPPIPPQYREKITVDLPYQEPVKVSSTLVRQLIRSELPVDPELCHPKVVEYLKKGHYYTHPKLTIPEFTLHCQTKEEIPSSQSDGMPVIVFMGSPGSGKSSLADQLSQETGYLFISTGDLYRYEKENKTHAFAVLERYKSDPLKFREALGQFIMFRIHTLVVDYLTKRRSPHDRKEDPSQVSTSTGTSSQQQQHPGIIIEGFKAGDLTHFTQHGWKVDQVIYVEVERALLAERVAKRACRDEARPFAHRVDAYYNVYLGEIQSEISQLVKKGLVKSLEVLDNNGTWEDSLSKLRTFAQFATPIGGTLGSPITPSSS